MPATKLISASGLNHFYGEGGARRQILFEVGFEVESGEIVILTGPSGGGKTTLLTLAGGLRTAQEGSLKVLGEELRGARQGALTRVRRRIGYIFQGYNLFDALTAGQNVQMALLLHERAAKRVARERAAAALETVGLGHRIDHLPKQLSGGEKQRVAIARALIGAPALILADEPTAALDRKSGRDVVELMRRLTRERGCGLLLVTHDNRILDIADRIIGLEDGRLSSFTSAVASNTRQMMNMLADSAGKGELTRQLRELPPAQFVSTLERVTGEFEQFMHTSQAGASQALDSMLERLIEAFTFQAGRILGAERVSLFMVDRTRGVLWSRVAQSGNGQPLEITIPIDHGVAGRVAQSGIAVCTADAYQEPWFDRSVDLRTGYRTRSLLCLPLSDAQGQVFAVAELLNKAGDAAFDSADQKQFEALAGPLGTLLQMGQRLGQAGVLLR
jgi:putative ABC transport system ATP-binding protein